MRIVRTTLLIISVLLTAASCSVGMAMSGKPDPNTGALHVGQSRDEVLLHLGQPTETFATEDRRTDVYRLERGNQQSPGRAIGHAVMDLLTLGLWEIIGTPVEGFAGEKFTLSIAYDDEDKVTSIKTGPSAAAFEKVN